MASRGQFPRKAAKALPADHVTGLATDKDRGAFAKPDMPTLALAGIHADTLTSAAVVQIDADQPGGRELGSVLRACGLTVLHCGLSRGIEDAPPLVMLAGNRNRPAVMGRLVDHRQRDAAPSVIMVLPGPGTPAADDAAHLAFEGVADVLRVAGIPFLEAPVEA